MEIHLSDARYEEIKTRVVQMFDKYDIHYLPVDGFELASKMGITLVPYSTMPQSAKRILYEKCEDGFSVEREYGEWFICYNDFMDKGRLSYTLMHEIGHIVLEHSEASKLAEKEANFFAKYALAPPVLIHYYQITNPKEVSELFGISHEAAQYALAYYQKWLTFGQPAFTNYEEQLLSLFAHTN